MIVGDRLEAPDTDTKYLRLSARELQRGYCRRTYHLREDGGGLVVAEGEEPVFTLPRESTGVAAVQGRVFAHDPEKKWLFLMKQDKSGYQNIYGQTYEPYRVLHYYTTSGRDQFFGVTKENVLYYNGNETVHIGAGKGGSCAAVFHDRLFTAKGDRVYYSAPLDGYSWNEGRYGAGYLDLPSDESGEILGMQPYKDRLYFLRKHGITCLRVLGDELNFKAVHLPMKCGALVENSVALCGEKIGYFTDGGFYLFNGAASALAENARFEEIDFSGSVKAVSYGGRYYALVTKKEGGRTLYCYDPEQCEAHFIERGAADIASGDDLYFSRGSLAYRLKGKGIPQDFTPCLTAKGIAFGLGKEKMLRAVAIEGGGTFGVTVTSNRGKRTVAGNANGILKLRSPLRGSGFDIKIDVLSADAAEVRFRAILFRFTEEEDDD